jgi:hypothetical protein
MARRRYQEAERLSTPPRRSSVPGAETIILAELLAARERIEILGAQLPAPRGPRSTVGARSLAKLSPPEKPYFIAEVTKAAAATGRVAVADFRPLYQLG